MHSCVRKEGNPLSGSGDYSWAENEPPRLQEKSRIKTQGGKIKAVMMVVTVVKDRGRFVKQILANGGQIGQSAQT